MIILRFYVVIVQVLNWKKVFSNVRGRSLDKGIGLSKVGVYSQYLQFIAGFSGGGLLRKQA